VEPVSEEVEETSREGVSTAHEALFPGTSEADPDDQDSFTKLLAELNLEIEEEVDIELGGELDREGSSLCPTPVENQEAEVFRMAKEWDVRIDHPTSASGSIKCSEEVRPTKFSQDTQEVPGCVAEQEPERLTLGILLPASDHVGSAKVEGEEEVLYTTATTPVDKDAFTVDSNEVQRHMDLQEVFSFHTSDGTTVQNPPDGTTVQDIMYQMMTDETFPIYDDDVVNALSHTGNEFTPTLEREIITLQTGGECFQLGRGDCSPTTEDRKENSEDKLYFHPVRLPCQKESTDAHLSMESRLSSSWQQEAVSPISVRNTERRPTKRIRTTLSPTVKPR